MCSSNAFKSWCRWFGNCSVICLASGLTPLYFEQRIIYFEHRTQNNIEEYWRNKISHRTRSEHRTIYFEHRTQNTEQDQSDACLPAMPIDARQRMILTSVRAWFAAPSSAARSLTLADRRATPVREYLSTGYGLRLSTEIYGSKQEKTASRETEVVGRVPCIRNAL